MIAVRRHRRLATALAGTIGIVSFFLIASAGIWLAVLAGIGIIYWVRDVRNIRGDAPKWLNFVVGAALWVALGIGAVSLRTWADRYFSHVGLSFWGGISLALALVFIGFGAWIYLAVPSDRVITRWQQMPWDLGALCALLPLGIAILIAFVALALIPDAGWAQAVFLLGGALGLVALVLFFWQPRWIKPDWMKAQD